MYVRIMEALKEVSCLKINRIVDCVWSMTICIIVRIQMK